MTFEEIVIESLSLAFAAIHFEFVKKLKVIWKHPYYFTAGKAGILRPVSAILYTGVMSVMSILHDSHNYSHNTRRWVKYRLRVGKMSAGLWLSGEGRGNNTIRPKVCQGWFLLAALDIDSDDVFAARAVQDSMREYRKL